MVTVHLTTVACARQSKIPHPLQQHLEQQQQQRKQMKMFDKEQTRVVRSLSLHVKHVASLRSILMVSVLLLLCWSVTVTSFDVPSIRFGNHNDCRRSISYRILQSHQTHNSFTSNQQMSHTKKAITTRRSATTTTLFTSTNSESAPSPPTTTTTSSRDSTPSKSTSTIGKWEEIHGNFLLRPKLDEGPPRALLHFLGGAIVGKSPHIAYRYMLERLAAKGYVVVATPYDLSFDYLTTCDDIISRFERIAIPLARQYGALPVIGIGHSCGSLLQVLITSLFPDTPRAANALISYNNKPVSEAVPFFDEFFAPFFTYVAARNETTRSSGSDIIRVSLDLASYAVKGELPTDDLLTKAGKLLLLPTPLRPFIQNNPIALPVVLRNSYKVLTSPVTTAIGNAGLVPIMTEILQTLQQIPSLIDEVADGAKDFNPPSAQIKAAARRSYRARRTLLVQYQDDPIDESSIVEELLQTAGQIIQMKRPMIPIDVQLKTMTGNHATPCIAPPLDIAQQVETLLGTDTAKDVLFYAQADATVEELIRWLDEANL